MSLRNRLAGAVLTLGLILTFSVAAFAQEQTGAKPQPPARGMRGEGRGGRGSMPMMRLLRNLNLTDAQRQDVQTILERFRQNTAEARNALMLMRGQREQGDLSDADREKAEALHAQMKEAQTQMRAELLAILTPEQRAQFEKKEQEMKARRAERRGRGDGDMMPPPDEQ